MVKEKAPAYQRYPGDYLNDENVARMSLEQEGAYNRLMDFCWREGSIPSDLPGLAALCKNVSTRKMQSLWVGISMCFRPHPSERGRLIHPRLEKERKKQEAFRKQMSEAGKRGADKRWGNDDQPHSEATDTPMASDSSSVFSSQFEQIKEKEGVLTHPRNGKTEHAGDITARVIASIRPAVNE